MSRRAPFWALEVAPVRTSLVIGCRSGSMQTSLQTSVRRLAVRSLILLCLMDRKPPFGQDRACSKENLAPHPHVDGVCRYSQLYWRASVPACYHKQESLKKRAYEQRVREVEHSSFTPQVLSATGGMANEATIFYKRLASCLAMKWDPTHTPPPCPGLSPPLSHPMHQGCMV